MNDPEPLSNAHHREEMRALQRHEPNDECDGQPVPPVFGGNRCPECRVRLCSCEMAYGHDCE